MTKTAQDYLLQWLRDAHAMEMQAETMLTSQAKRIEHYPELKARIERHIEETRQQAKLIEGCIERCGGGTSTTKDLAGKFTAMMQGLSGIPMGDEVVKGAMAGYTFEHFEICSYRALIAAANVAGDAETERVCRQILKQEEEMAAWLAEHLPQVTAQFLRRVEADVSAKV
ncbi:MAG TPA: ferritin-like domain-containing protein [Afifellaceae bacterium]|nr:ferritin-like domain-containing protein [Afifellaceae bacterium]